MTWRKPWLFGMALCIDFSNSTYGKRAVEVREIKLMVLSLNLDIKRFNRISGWLVDGRKRYAASI